MCAGKTTAELNNLGVTSLANGDLRKAHGLFYNALVDPFEKFTLLKAMKAALNQNQIRVDISSLQTVLQMHHHSSTRCGQVGETSSKAITGTGYLTLEMKSKGTFIYSHGINIAPTIAELDHSSPECLFVKNAIVSAIIIFNIGIVHHLNGMTEEHNQSKRLQKAKSLYTKSATILVEAGVPLSSTGIAVIDLLSMALLNNLGQIAYELFDYKQSKAFFESLVQLLQKVDITDYQHSDTAMLMAQQKSEFYLNAFILFSHRLAAAA